MYLLSPDFLLKLSCHVYYYLLSILDGLDTGENKAIPVHALTGSVSAIGNHCRIKLEMRKTT